MRAMESNDFYDKKYIEIDYILKFGYWLQSGSSGSKTNISKCMFHSYISVIYNKSLQTYASSDMKGTSFYILSIIHRFLGRSGSKFIYTMCRHISWECCKRTFFLNQNVLNIYVLGRSNI